MNRRDKILFTLRLACSGTVALVMVVFGWPLVFVPGIWEGYTCWESDDEC